MLVHGLFGAATDWDGVVAELATDHRIIRFDLRGHGQSGTPTADYGIADHQHDVLAAMEAVGVERALVVGHGIGGIATLRLAVERPDRVEGIVVLNTTAEAEENALPWRVLGRAARQFGVRPFIVDQIASRLFGRNSLQVKAAAVAAWKARLASTAPEQVHRALRAWVRRPSIENQLGKIGVYALSVAGADDPAIKPDNAKRVMEAIPNARHKIVPGAGHLLPLEKPEAVIEWIRWSLDEMVGSRDMRTGMRRRP